MNRSPQSPAAPRWPPVPRAAAEPGMPLPVAAPGSNPVGGASPPGASPAGPDARSWTIELPAGMRLLNLNDRRHWAEKGRITRDLRKAAWACARNAHIPHLERARVTVEFQPPLNGRHRDADNLAAAGKPAIDGALVDARILANDDAQHLIAVTYRIGEPFPRGRLVLHVTEVAL